MVRLIAALKFRRAFGVWPFRGNAGSRVETVLRTTWLNLLDPMLSVKISDARKVALEKLKTVAEACGFSAAVQKVRAEVIKKIDRGISFISFPGNQG